MSYAEEMKEIMREEFERVFGDITEFGCYCRNGEWLSTKAAFELVCDVIDNCDYMFEE